MGTLSQDTIRGMKENATQGFRNGGTLPFGYRSSSESHGSATKSKLIPDEREAPIVRRAFELAAQGQGARKIASSLNAEGLRTRHGKHFQAAGINHMLRNETYVGTIVWNRYSKGLGSRQRKDDTEVIRVPDCHLSLVDKDVFEEVQALLTSRRPLVKHPMRVSSRYLLSGLAHCAQCSSAAIGGNGKFGKYLYYRCNGRLTKGAVVCDGPAINAKKLEAFVLDRIKENILTEENLRELVDLANEELRLYKRRVVSQLDRLNREATSVEQGLAHLYAALESGKVDIDDLAPRLKELRARQRELSGKKDEALDEMNQTGDTFFDSLVMEDYLGDLRRVLQSASFLECKTFLGTFIRRIDFNRQQVGIEYTMPILAADGSTKTTEVLSVRGVGSPSRPTPRTFVWAWFELPQPASRRNRSESIRQERRNPVALALDWQQHLDSGEFTSRAELARSLGVTGAHVTQVLSLLHLAPEVRSLILSFGDLIRGKGLGIHTLRSLLHLPVDKQINWIKESRTPCCAKSRKVAVRSQ